MNRKPLFPKLGSISHGTMRPEDLVPTFVAELRSLSESLDLDARCHDTLVAFVADLEGRLAADDYYADAERVDDDLNNLHDLFNTLAPPYSMFGSHPGDGSDYGFWPDMESLEDAARDGDALKVSDTSEVPGDHSGPVMHVNDHGNVTLYACSNGELEEIWGVV